MVSQAETLLEARLSNRSSALVQRVLSAMCDCTVYLDASLNISKPRPLSADMLLRRGTVSLRFAHSFVNHLPNGKAHARAWNLKMLEARLSNRSHALVR